MPDIGPVVLLILGVVAVNGLAGRIRLPAPILLVIVGLGVSFIPRVPDFEDDPEVILNEVVVD